MAALQAQSIRVQDPVDLDLSRVCFNENWIKIYAYDVHDTCFWEADADFIQFNEPSTFNNNTKGDTIQFRFSRDQDERLKGTVTITVKVGRTPKDLPDGELKLTIVPKASNVQDVKWQEPLCQNLPIELAVNPIDENYKTGYAPGQLNLEWEFIESGNQYGRLNRTPVTKEDDFKTVYDFSLPTYRDGTLKATFYTCDDYRHEAVTLEKTLAPFVVQGLYKDEKIYPLRLKPVDDGGMGGGDAGADDDKTDIWEVDGSKEDPNTIICRSYDDLWVGYIDDSRRYVYLGFGNFTERLAAADTSRFPERFYSYHWDFDPDEFEYARQEMSDNEKYDFGKSRVALRVKGGKEGGSAVNKEHTVRLTVRCDECIKRGGSEKDFTYTTAIKLYRQDSISDYHDATNPIDYTLVADGSVCANQKVKLQLSMDEQSTLNFRKISNAKYYTVSPEKKREGDSAYWLVNYDDTKDISSDPNLFKYQYGFTAVRTDDWNGTPGDTVYVRVYPRNDCFRNLRQEGLNGKTFKVFVKNPPLPPLLYDPVTAQAVQFQYTDLRWKQLMDKNPDLKGQQESEAERFFVCNHTPIQDQNWVSANQRFGLYVKGDSIFNPDPLQADFKLVDYDGYFLDQKKIQAEFEPRTAGTDYKKDSSWVRIYIREANRPTFDATKQVKVGFYAYNACGAGDTAVYRIRILDTLSAIDLFSNTRVNGWDTLCEGMALELESTSNDHYFKRSDMQIPSDWSLVETDRVDYAWKAPTDWTFTTDTNVKTVGLRVGAGSGSVGLRLGNRCGYGSYLDSAIFVHPFVRVTMVGDTTPCRGAEVTYRFKQADFAEGYRITWPGDDWVERSSQVRNDSMVYTVVVGDKEEGPIYIVGQKTKAPGLKPKPLDETEENFGCNFQFDNYPSHNRDSLKVRVKHFTAQPKITGDFPRLSKDPDTLCADNDYRFQVEKGADRDDSVFFKWFFPDGWPEPPQFSKHRDTVDFLTPERIAQQEKLIISVVASRYDCDATNQGDTLKIPVWLTDTVPPARPFLDAHPGNAMSGDRVNPAPCEGDTVYYTLNKRLQHSEAYYALFDVRPMEATGELADDWAALSASDWKILDGSDGHDTLKMIVGRDPMRLRVAMVSRCDTSSFTEDTIYPISKVIDAGNLRMERPDNRLCEFEAVSFVFDTVRHATHYVFHYLWGDKTDTVRVAEAEADLESGRLTEEGRYRISFADTFAYTAGKVYVEAWNSCGVRPDDDPLDIEVLRTADANARLLRLDFADFDYDSHLIGQDTVQDSLCLRVPLVLEAGQEDAVTAATEGWRFHYAWRLTAEDASVTAFDAYASDDWAVGAGLNASDSLWTMTKEAGGLDVNYLWLSSRHETCERFGDTLTIALRATDTTALPEGKTVWNYLYDKEAEEKNGKRTHIQTKPCANEVNEVAYYLDLSALDATGESYYFRWRRDSTEAFDNVYDPSSHRIAGGKFVLNNAPDDGDWTTLDTLKMTLPSFEDTLEIQVVVRNRCNEAHLPGLTIETADAIAPDAVYAVVPVSPYICDQEELTYKVVTLTTDGTKTDTTDGVAKAGQYIWYAPWREKSDTTDVFTMTFEAAAFQPGTVYVVPNNGCGDGHKSEAVVIAEADILQPPLRVEPATIDGTFAYDSDKGELLDSLCLRSDYDLAVRAELAPGSGAGDGGDSDAGGAASDPDAPQNRFSYGWSTAYGLADALTIPDAADSTRAVVTIPDFADSAYIVYVAARRSVCQRFGDSLRIELFPMDTIRFINDPAEDDEPFNRFTVLTRDALQDGWPTATVDEVSLSPCVGSTHTYGIKPDFHWSLTTTDAGASETAVAGKSGRRAKRAAKAAVDENRLHFSWNGGQTGATDGLLDGTTSWHSLQPDQLPYVLDVEVGTAADPLHLSVHAKNICGPSVSRPLTIEPHALMDPLEKPVPSLLSPVCEGDGLKIGLESPLAAADGYVWTASFRGGATDTTAEPTITYADYAVADGTVTVYGFNACGDGMPSDPLDLKPLLHIPEQPVATWFDGLTVVADTVYDTICVSGNSLLCVRATVDDEAEDGIVYQWELLPEYADYAVLTSISDRQDSVYIAPRGLLDGEDLRLRVMARRASCTRWSEPLYIALNMTSVAAVESLGRLIWYDPSGTGDDRTESALQAPLCPGTMVRIGVENETAAPAYRWLFPDRTWTFAEGEDSTAAVVRVLVGETAGTVRVMPLTDPDNRRCHNTEAPDRVLSSEMIELVSGFEPRVFATFDDAPCAGMTATYTVEPLSGEEVAGGKFKHHRWVFPATWRVYGADGQLTASNILENSSTVCRVLPDSTAGIVRVYAVSACTAGGDGDNGQSSVSRPAEREARPKDTARLAIVADVSVCKDSTLQIELQALNTWTYATGYGLDVAYLGSDAAVVNPAEPLVFDFPKAPDSSLVMVDWYSGDSVRLTFTPRHTAGCLAKSEVYALRADTVPTILGRIEGPDLICRGGEATFTAVVTNLEADVEVDFRWETLEDEGWEIVSLSDDNATVTVRAGDYADVAGDALNKVLRCYPRALCGTAKPFEKELTVNPPAPFNGTLQVFTHPDHTLLTPADRPCIGSDLAFELTHTDAPAPVRYLWLMPEGWQRTTTGTVADSTAQAVFTASKAGADTLRVRFMEPGNPLSCGLSQALVYVVAVRDSAPKARLTRPPYPCNTRSEVEFTVAPDAEIESAAWTWPAGYDADGKAEVRTDPADGIRDNKLILKELTEGAGFADAFDLVVRSVNVCGARDTVMRVQPVGEIADLADGAIQVSHYCPGDSAYAYVEIPPVYVGTGTDYHWVVGDAEPVYRLTDSLIRENDDPQGAEKIAWMWFEGPETVADTATVGFYAQNDCNSTETVTVRTAPYAYAILARAVFADEADTAAVYGQAGIGLEVAAVQYGTPADYTYDWQPADRVTMSRPDAPSDPANTFATRALYQRVETFHVTSTERIDETAPFYYGRSACRAHDTVRIFVDSTFAMAPKPLDTACIGSPFTASARPYGGNVDRYYFDWYRGTDTGYVFLAEAGHAAEAELTIDDALIRLMVVGCDTTLLYAEGDQPAPDDPDDPDQPEPADPDDPDNPDDPIVPDAPAGEPLYVFTQVDTQYIELRAFEVSGRWVLPGREEIQVPFGTKVRLSVEGRGGSRQYVYGWSPEELMERHDSTASSLSTLRIYENSEVQALIRDTVTGCQAALQLRIEMQDKIGDVPNGFSPNGDGINDIFMKGTDLVIYNRFGMELFRSTHQEGWDGTFKGATVAPGDYLYVVTIRKDGKTYTKKGTVTVFTK